MSHAFDLLAFSTRHPWRAPYGTHPRLGGTKSITPKPQRDQSQRRPRKAPAELRSRPTSRKELKLQRPAIRTLEVEAEMELRNHATQPSHRQRP
ncbi:hypothetical protein YC2023_019918 [Brassica napus]